MPDSTRKMSPMVKPEKTVKPSKKAKPEKKGKPEKRAKPVKKAKPVKNAKPETSPGSALGEAHETEGTSSSAEQARAESTALLADETAVIEIQSEDPGVDARWPNSPTVSLTLGALSERARSGLATVRGAFGNRAARTEVLPVAASEGMTAVAHHFGVETLFTAIERPPLAALEANDISAWFGDHQVLEHVSLTMPAGVITSLIGPSGCGKSTFLRILNRMHELIPSASLAGEVLLDGEDIYDAERRLVDARKNIGMVFQKPNPFPAMSIYDNVVAGLKLTGLRVDRDHRDYLVESSLIKAGLWKEVKDRLRAPGGGLSGGQQQRLCIARSLAVAPKVLLMDEPCSALDPTSTRVIEETMLELAQEVTIVIVTHNMQQAQRVSTQCAFFLAAQGKPGGIVEHGSTEAMFSDPIDPRTHDYVNGVFG